MRKFSISSLGPIIGAIVIAAVVLTVFYGISGFAGGADDTQIEAQIKAIDRAAVQCYAIEGQYAATLEHLAENYGLMLDYESYAYEYTAVASNIKPIVRVVPLGSSIETDDERAVFD